MNLFNAHLVSHIRMILIIFWQAPPMIMGESRSVTCLGLYCWAWQEHEQRKALASNLSRSVFRVKILELHLPTSVGLGAYSSWLTVTQHHHLLAEIFSTAEGHLCSRHWFWYTSTKKVTWCVWFLEQGTRFNDLKIPLRNRDACILSAFLMNWKLGKDQNYFIPSEISVLLKITSIESSS